MGHPGFGAAISMRCLVVGDFAVAAGDAADDAVALVGAVEDGLGLLDLSRRRRRR